MIYVILATHRNGQTFDRLVDFSALDALLDFFDCCDPDLYLSACLIDNERGAIIKEWRADR